MAETHDGGMAPLRRDQVVASDLIAMRELLKAEILSVRELLSADVRALNARLDALNESGLALVKQADEAIRSELVTRMEAIRHEMLLIQKAEEEAIDKADAATEKRFESMNEFRKQLSDQTRTFATREMVDTAAAARIARFEQAEGRIKDLEFWRSNTEGRQAIRAILWPVIVGVVVFIMTQIMRVMFPAPLQKAEVLYEVPEGTARPTTPPRTP